MEVQKNNKGVIALLIVIIGILSVLCILLATGTITFKNNDVNNKETNQNVTENYISKIDNNKNWIYDADYNLPTNKDSYYGYDNHTKLISATDLVVPYINIDSDDAKKANQEIYKLYEELINRFNRNLTDEIWFTTVEYKTYTNDNIVSIVITTETAGTDVPLYEYYTYNFNLTDGKSLSYTDAYKMTGLNMYDITDKASKAIVSNLREMGLNEEDINLCSSPSINNYKDTVDNSTIRFFIDGNKKLNIIVNLTIPAGRGNVDKVITVE